MSLMDTFLLDAYPLDVWVTARSDGVIGSGTEDDPFDGSTRVLPSPPSVSISSSDTNTATVTIGTGHGLQNGQLVLISGASGYGAYYNGTFAIFDVQPGSFSYTMYAAPPSGSVTASCQPDPYFFDALMRALPLPIISITSSGTTTATLITHYHGYSVGNRVLINGVTGTDGQYYNGTFVVTAVSDVNTFQYTLNGVPSGAAQGAFKTCRLVGPAPVTVAVPVTPPVAVRLGPGTMETKGYSSYVSASWMPAQTMKIFGPGLGLTTLKLVGALIDFITDGAAPYVAISSPGNQFTTSLELADFSVDCNISGQPGVNLACGAINVVGTQTRIRCVRAINFGTQVNRSECFVIAAANAQLNNPECVHCVIEDCIVEQPALNNSETTTLLSILQSGGGNNGIMSYHRACVIRNCFVDCEYRQNPVPVSIISFNSMTGVATVTTGLPHQHSNGDYVRISGGILNGSPDNAFNGTYVIGNVSANSFTYTPTPAPASSPTGEIWVGRFPSQNILISSIALNGPPYIATVTTIYPHFLVVNQIVKMSGFANDNFNKPLQVSAVDSPTQFKISFANNPGSVATTGIQQIGVPFQGPCADCGTAAVVEGNRVVGTITAGPYHDTFNSRDLLVRNNYQRAVQTGPYQNLGGMRDPFGCTMTFVTSGNGYLVTVNTSPNTHGFVIGDAVHIANIALGYSAFFAVTAVPDNTHLKFMAPQPPPSSGTIAWLDQTDRLALENNIIEVIPNHSGQSGAPAPWGTAFNNGNSALTSFPPALFQQLLIRRNILRHTDGLSDPLGNDPALALTANFCGNMVVEENVIDLSASQPMVYAQCGNTEFFANQTPGGALVQGYNSLTSQFSDELTTQIQDCVLCSF